MASLAGLALLLSCQVRGHHLMQASTKANYSVMLVCVCVRQRWRRAGWHCLGQNQALQGDVYCSLYPHAGLLRRLSVCDKDQSVALCVRIHARPVPHSSRQSRAYGLTCTHRPCPQVCLGDSSGGIRHCNPCGGHGICSRDHLPHA